MSLSWGTKRQFVFMGIIVTGFLIAGVVLAWPYFHKEPTCFDGEMNGDESGLDCGGSCTKVCTAEALRLVTLWVQPFEVVPGKYNVMAYIENQNRESGIPFMTYEFKLYDEDNIFIGRTSGSGFVTSNDRTAIFEAGIETGNRVPKRATFAFTSAPTWIKVNREQKNALAVSAEDMVLEDPLSSPKLTAMIDNKTLRELKNIDVYAVLYDATGNVMTASKTVVDILPKNGRSGVVFTWPKPLTERPTRIDVFPQLNVFELPLDN